MRSVVRDKIKFLSWKVSGVYRNNCDLMPVAELSASNWTARFAGLAVNENTRECSHNDRSRFKRTMSMRMSLDCDKDGHDNNRMLSSRVETSTGHDTLRAQTEQRGWRESAGVPVCDCGWDRLFVSGTDPIESWAYRLAVSLSLCVYLSTLIFHRETVF